MGKFLPFDEALAAAQSLGLATQKEWEAWCKEGVRPPNMPSHPNNTYKDGGWQGWGHWLGTGNQSSHTKRFLPFDSALAVARSANLPNFAAWRVWCKVGMCPPDVPSTPQRTYKGRGWQGWGHWLGTGSQSNKTKKEQFLPFHDALRVARQLRLVSYGEWKVWCRSGARPANMPARPDQTYVHDGWSGWEHFLQHASLGPALALAVVHRTVKRAAAGCPGVSGKSGGKRRRR